MNLHLILIEIIYKICNKSLDYYFTILKSLKGRKV